MALRDSGVTPVNNAPQSGVVAGLFHDNDQAERAIDDLKKAGFTDNQIGVAWSEGDDLSEVNRGGAESELSRRPHGMWDKIKSAFSGDTDEKYDKNNYSYDENYSTNEDFNQSLSGMGFNEDQSRYFSGNIHEAGCLVTVRTEPSRTSEAVRILERNGADLGSGTVNFGKNEPNSTSTLQGNRRIQLLGEVLRVHKQRISRGEVRIRKEVVSETKNIQVPVTHEELVVERSAVANEQPATGEIGQDQEIRIPLSQEEVRVEKQPVVTGEVNVGKRQVQDTRSVTDNVRHEELRVDKEGQVESEVKKKKGGTDRAA